VGGPATALLIGTPGGLEAYFAELSAALAADADPARVAILVPLALLSALVGLALPWPNGRTAEFWWLAAGFLLMVAALGVTLAVEVPTDRQIQAWTAATLPADWRSIQARWERWHTLRTFLSIAAVVAATLSVTIAAPPTQPPANHTDPRGRPITKDRSP
jgi:hypothetical protein